MKQTVILAILTIMLLSSGYTSKQSVYEKVIADDVGTWTDLKFEALSVEKTTDITVADRINNLRQKVLGKEKNVDL